MDISATESGRRRVAFIQKNLQEEKGESRREIA